MRRATGALYRMKGKEGEGREREGKREEYIRERKDDAIIKYENKN